VSYAARFQVKPSNTEITAVKRILQYLNSTRDMELVYSISETKTFNFVVYADASFAPQGEKSTSGWIIFVNGSVVVWKTLKQSITAKSSAEAEYIALSQAVSDAIYLRSILMELGYEVATIQVYEDNAAAIQIATNLVFKSKVKQVNVHYHFIRDYVRMGTVEISHIQSRDQVADMFTKGLNGPLFKHLMEKLGLRMSISEGNVKVKINDSDSDYA
jgi:rubrerythrin